jgi:AcrR family transcriptional regulator
VKKVSSSNSKPQKAHTQRVSAKYERLRSINHTATLKLVERPASRPAAKPRQIQARTQLSDARMLEAAMDLIRKYGTHNVTLKAVGELAGYSRGLASARWGTKDALFCALISAAIEKLAREMHSAIAGKAGFAAISAWLKTLEHLLRDEASYVRTLYILCYETIGSSEMTRRQIAAAHLVQRSQLECWFAEAISEGSLRSSATARQLTLYSFSMFYGVIYQWLIEPDVINPRRIFTDLRNLLKETIHPRSRSRQKRVRRRKAKIPSDDPSMQP